MKAIHKTTGERGTIIKELNSYNPPQYGIIWGIKYTATTPSHYFWNDKDDIIVEQNTCKSQPHLLPLKS